MLVTDKSAWDALIVRPCIHLPFRKKTPKAGQARDERRPGAGPSAETVRCFCGRLDVSARQCYCAPQGSRAQANCPSVLPASVTQPVIALRNAAVVRRQLVSPASVNTTTACQSQYSNPLIDSDFPDPSEPIVGQDGRLYVYATNSLGFNIQYATASAGDLTTWTYANADALPDSGFPSWASSDDGYTWAPGVMQINGVFVMYYTVRSIADKTQCISRATSPLAAGPFHDSSSAPLICQIALGGSIDPQPFQDSDGQLYLAWKNDGNSIGKGTAIFLQQLSADGAALLGPATQLLQADSPWEVGIIEAPSIQLCEGGQYCLFYSGGPYAGDQYAVGVAVAPSVRGPYTKYAGNPVLSTTALSLYM
ncbi:hypothetical protein WJX84_011191 [Apatococcus fuscideae]|uniref:Glycoside hydrolase family 43 protein n=1 Tax=Apatococcus fuscideae TaxID=2026836 RepID=A0AAW1SR46_9CHLO